MARCPFAIWKPVSENARNPALVPTQFIFHSTWGGGSNPWGYFDHGSGGISSHFWVGNKGELYQFEDTLKKAYAQFEGNNHGISVETADLGNPHSQGWNGPQLATLTRLLAWVHQVHPAVPLRLCPADDAPGVGWHAKFYDWNRNGHDCPGPARIKQVPGIISAAAGGHIHPVCRIGSKGEPVKDIQRRINAHGYRPPLVVDGDFGPKTDAAVKAFQRTNHLVVDGIVGPLTWAALLKG